MAGAVLTLDQALARAYRHFCWPIIFGRFKCDDLRALTSYHSSVFVAPPNHHLLVAEGAGNCDQNGRFDFILPLNKLARKLVTLVGAGTGRMN